MPTRKNSKRSKKSSVRKSVRKLRNIRKKAIRGGIDIVTCKGVKQDCSDRKYKEQFRTNTAVNQIANRFRSEAQDTKSPCYGCKSLD